MKNVLSLKLFLHLFFFFFLKRNPYTLFFSCNQTKSLWYKLQKLLNSEIFLPQNTPQSAFFIFPDNKENFEIINHFHLMFKYYLLKCGMQEKHNKSIRSEEKCN